MNKEVEKNQSNAAQNPRTQNRRREKNRQERKIRQNAAPKVSAKN